MNHRHDLTEHRVPMPVITLLTDFGLEDEYVGVMKGVILSMCPDARIIDICHHVAPQDVCGGAFMLRSTYRYFPSQTIHLAVVDPGVGSSRSIVAIRAGNQMFVAPDNGILTFILEENRIERAVRVDNPQHVLTPVSRTFHGRDIFAPVAAHLACGIDFASLGSLTDPRDLARLPLKPAGIDENGNLAGSVIHIDRFGNLVTDIHQLLLSDLLNEGSILDLEIVVGDHVVRGLSDSYSDANPGQLMAVIGSRDMLEIAVNQNHAAGRTGSKVGDPVLVRVAK